LSSRSFRLINPLYRRNAFNRHPTKTIRLAAQSHVRSAATRWYVKVTSFARPYRNSRLISRRGNRSERKKKWSWNSGAANNDETSLSSNRNPRTFKRYSRRISDASAGQLTEVVRCFVRQKRGRRVRRPLSAIKGQRSLRIRSVVIYRTRYFVIIPGTIENPLTIARITSET